MLHSSKKKNNSCNYEKAISHLYIIFIKLMIRRSTFFVLYEQVLQVNFAAVSSCRSESTFDLNNPNDLRFLNTDQKIFCNWKSLKAHFSQFLTMSNVSSNWAKKKRKSEKWNGVYHCIPVFFLLSLLSLSSIIYFKLFYILHVHI